MEGDPALIALHGVKGAGKDTTFDFIVKWCAGRSQPLSAVRRGFGDKVKWAFARQFMPGITEEAAIEWANTFKDREWVEIEFPTKALAPDEHEFDTLTFRQAIAQFATESARDIYGWDFWVDQVLPLEPTSKHPEGWRGLFMVPPRTPEEDPYSFAHFAVITDLRFENEMERVKKLDGLTVKIKRRDAEQAVIAEAKRQGRKIHESELGLADDMFDVVIDNSDSDLHMAHVRTVHLMNEINRNGIASIQRGIPIPWRL